MQGKQIRHLLALLTVVLASATLAFGAAEGNFDRTLKVSGPADLEISTGSGHINVRTGPGGTVSIHAHVRVSENFLFSENSQAKLQRIIANPPIEQNGNIIKVGRIDDPDLRRNVAIDYDVTVPPETRLVSKTGSGDQKVDGIRGPLVISTGSGTLKVANIGSEVRASTGSGDVDLDNINGAVVASTGSGRITANKVAGAFNGTTGSGDISVEQTAPGNVTLGTGSGTVTAHNIKGSLSVGTGSGDVRADGELVGDWKVESGSGSVTLQLPGQASFDLYARSSSGRITVDNHELTLQGTINRREVRGKVHGGGHSVDLRTGSGDILVR
jgi:DUF4097 and DUF4098 domain-containing protein YvlB